MRVRAALASSGTLFCVIAVFTASGARAGEREAASPPEQRVQGVVIGLKQRLSIPAAIVVSVVPTNALMMSVEAPAADGNPFRLAVDAAFLDRLTDDELEAAVAHELGHVWVYTHHPYLQTEQLANEIAMRVVTRESLERLYIKLARLRPGPDEHVAPLASGSISLPALRAGETP